MFNLNKRIPIDFKMRLYNEEKKRLFVNIYKK